MSSARSSFVVIAGCAALVFAATTCVPGSVLARSKRAKSSPETSVGRAAQQIVQLTNRQRAQHGLPALRIDGRCVSAITGHVTDMARSGFLSHDGSDGRGPNERYRKYAPSSRGAGENLAYNTSGTGESFMRQWMNSSDHRSNILNSRYKAMGVAVRANCSDRKETGKCTYYAGQCFSL
ncbi:MAG: CAP domain-containing protein [Hyphomicrobiaceae bacterium]